MALTEIPDLHPSSHQQLRVSKDVFGTDEQTYGAPDAPFDDFFQRGTPAVQGACRSHTVLPAVRGLAVDPNDWSRGGNRMQKWARRLRLTYRCNLFSIVPSPQW